MTKKGTLKKTALPGDVRAADEDAAWPIQDIVDHSLIEKQLTCKRPSSAELKRVIDRALQKTPLTIEQTAVLLAADQPAQVEAICAAASQLKDAVYGKRIVLFAPLYVGNLCINDCAYCAFKRSNDRIKRKSLDADQLSAEVRALEAQGHKRLILVFGEHPKYGPEVIADTVRRVYAVKEGHGAIRRVNINAAPLSVEGFRQVHQAGIGTYQVFQETYHRPTYGRYHPAHTQKGDYEGRLRALDRAQLAGVDDVGIGALFGLYDWRYEVLALVSHALHLQRRFGVGPHTISFPRLRPALGVMLDSKYAVDHATFMRLIAILRLAVPYAGLILTAREEPQIRKEAMRLGVSQIDGGTRIDLGGYAGHRDEQPCAAAEQFSLGDNRSLSEVMQQLLSDGYLPSFCTACYRQGRTGEHFMEFAVPGFIKRYCTPNALFTLREYLDDYGSSEERTAGQQLIEEQLEALPNSVRQKTEQALGRVEQGERDVRW
jgi:2-iminoacetate synthase